MKRPAWAAAGGFAECWAALERLPRLDLSPLAKSRVITISATQTEELPRVSDAPNVLKEMRLPFDHVYLDLGRVKPFSGANDSLLLRGAQISQEGWFIPNATPAPSIAVFAQGFGRPTGLFALGGPTIEDAQWRWDFDSYWHPAETLSDSRKQLLALTFERCISVLQWLQSYNVELVEAPLSPRQRERELKKGRQIALTVQVKQTKRYTSVSQLSGSANYTHRFETRGHYAREFELKDDGTPNKNFIRYMQKRPTDAIVVDGRMCFQKWIPPHVKGPSDKPFVPKVREVVA